MIRSTYAMALMLGTTLVALDAAAQTTRKDATVCLNDVIRLQQDLHDRSLSQAQRAEIEKFLADARDKAEGADVAGCEQRIQEARSAFEAGVPGAGPTAMESSEAEDKPERQAEIDPTDKPETSRGMRTGADKPIGSADPEPGMAAVRRDIGSLVQSAGLTDLEGAEVANSDGETIGQVEQLVQSKDGEQVLLVLGVGGFLGLGERSVVVPYQEFRASDGALVLANADEQSLENRPVYDGDQYQTLEIDDILNPEPDRASGPTGSPPLTKTD